MDISTLPGCRVNVDGLSIHYKCLGKGRPVVLIHGSGNDCREWNANFADIAARFQVYALDLPGFGLSQMPAGVVSRDWSTDFIKHFLDKLGIESAYLIGHSMGAMLSLSLAARYPESVKKLVLIDAGGLGKLSVRGQLLLSVFRTVENWQGKKRGPKYLSRSAEEWRVLHELPKIKTPALIIWGQNDRYLPVSQSRLAHSLIHGSSLYIFPRCGHAPQREQPARFNSLILQFLEGDEISSPA